MVFFPIRHYTESESETLKNNPDLLQLLVQFFKYWTQHCVSGQWKQWNNPLHATTNNGLECQNGMRKSWYFCSCLTIISLGKIKRLYLTKGKVSTKDLVENKFKDLLVDWRTIATDFSPRNRIKSQLTPKLHSAASELFKKSSEMFGYKKKRQHRTMIKVTFYVNP